MRVAVAYKALSAASQQEPNLCQYIDNALSREAATGEELDADWRPIGARRRTGVELLSRGSGCMLFNPSKSVMVWDPPIPILCLPALFS